VSQNEPQDIQVIDLNGVEASQTINYPDLKSTVILFFVFILNMFIITIPAIIIIIGLNTLFLNSPLLKSLLNLLMYIATLLITIRYVIRKSKEQQGYFQRISFNKIQGWMVPMLIIGTLALIIPLEWVSDLIPMPKSVQKFFETTFTKDIFSIITMVIAAPIMEEILCRGIILRGLLKNYPPYKAILISAIFFGAIHLNPWQAIPASLGGLFLGWVYYKTQSVIPGIIIHATINITAALFLFLPNHQQDLSGLFGMPYYLVACVVSIIVFTTTCIIIHKEVLIIQKPVNDF
jgi:membrane protease YdiL (CAAX protease family)